MNKIKKIIADDSIFFGLLIVLVGVTAYGLGQHSVIKNSAISQSAQVVLIKEPTPSEVSSPADTQSIVASKNGSKYHFLWCPGASQMKEENKIFFDSTEAARAAGYEPAANCEGLQ